jgi:hypothetical protein
MPGRTPEEIRASIEQNREELGESLVKLRHEVTRITDWRSQLRTHRAQLMVVAAVGGFVLGGGVSVVASLALGRAKPSRGKR